MADLIYNSFKKAINGEIIWDDNVTTTIMVMLVDDTYVPDIDTHLFKNQITGEVTDVGTNYTLGGQELLNRTLAVDNTTDLGNYDGDDLNWATSTITARGAVIYKDTGDPATSPVIGYVDFGANTSSNAGDFRIEWHTNGIITLGQ